MSMLPIQSQQILPTSTNPASLNNPGETTIPSNLINPANTPPMSSLGLGDTFDAISAGLEQPTSLLIDGLPSSDVPLATQSNSPLDNIILAIKEYLEGPQDPSQVPVDPSIEPENAQSNSPLDKIISAIAEFLQGSTDPSQLATDPDSTLPPTQLATDPDSSLPSTLMSTDTDSNLPSGQLSTDPGTENTKQLDSALCPPKECPPEDPYEVNINGEKYMFVQDQNGNGKTDGKNEILGINDTKETLFQGMKDLDSNGDNIISDQELKNQGVVLAKVGEDGKVDNSQTANVQSVDLNSFKKDADFNGEGVAGTFNVNVGNQTLQGKSVFEDQAKLQSYLSA